ncbi:MAG: EAL domain-containing protein [Vibrio sp.]
MNIMLYIKYQPILQDGKVRGYEALSRHRDRNVNIQNFIDTIANKPAFDFDTLTRVLIDNKSNNLTIFVNIFPESLTCDWFVENILLLKNVLKNIVFEIIEQTCSDNQKFIESIKKLKDNGLSIAIDDFGSNHSNFNRIKEINPNFIKIDKKFTSQIDTNFMSFYMLMNLLEFLTSAYPSSEIIIEGIETLNENLMINSLEMYISKTILRQGFYFGYPEECFSSPIIDKLAHKFNENINCSAKSIKIEKLKKIFQSYNQTKNIEFFYEGINALKNLESKANFNFFNLFELSEKLIVLKDEQGNILYHNKAHRKVMNTNLLEINNKHLLSMCSNFKECQTEDALFLENKQDLQTNDTTFCGVNYIISRYKLELNNKRFILSFIVKKDNSKIISVDPCTGYLLRHDYSSYISYNTLAFIDLDNLKFYNDTVGYSAGDKHIYDFSNFLKQFFSKSDILIRHGGDEFIIICKKLHIEHLNKKLHKLQELADTQSLFFSFGCTSISGCIESSVSIASDIMKSNKEQRKHGRK